MAEVIDIEPPEVWLKRMVCELTGLTDVQVEPTATYNWYVRSAGRNTIVIGRVVRERDVQELKKDLFYYAHWPRRS